PRRFSPQRVTRIVRPRAPHTFALEARRRAIALNVRRYATPVPGAASRGLNGPGNCATIRDASARIFGRGSETRLMCGALDRTLEREPIVSFDRSADRIVRCD